MTDRIRLNDMVFYGYHGVQPEERTLGQRFQVDVELQVSLRAAGRDDDIQQTVNYVEVYRRVEEILTGPPFTLIEAVAERVAGRLLEDFQQVGRVSIRIRKPQVPIPGAMLGSSEVWIERDRKDLT